jgi:uncharacterized protein (DUF2141 family)
MAASTHRGLPVPSSLRSLLLAGLLTVATAAAAADGPNLRIIATNVQSDQGNIVVWVWESKEGWLREDAVRTRKSVPVTGNRAGDSVTVELLLPAGDYAVSVFHDREGDGRLERNFIGLPREPSGLSNNLRPRFGPPKFDGAKFTVGSGVVEQRIKLD